MFSSASSRLLLGRLPTPLLPSSSWDEGEGQRRESNCILQFCACNWNCQIHTFSVYGIIITIRPNTNHGQCKRPCTRKARTRSRTRCSRRHETIHPTRSGEEKIKWNCRRKGKDASCRPMAKDGGYLHWNTMSRDNFTWIYSRRTWNWIVYTALTTSSGNLLPRGAGYAPYRWSWHIQNGSWRMHLTYLF